MAIANNNNQQSYIFNKTFTISGGSESYVQLLSELNSQPFNLSKINLEVVCAGLDSTVILSQFKGNSNVYASMSPILDTSTGVAIADVLTNGSYFITSGTDGFFLGLYLNVGTATTGTVTIIGRA